jgi:hypothetical protein
MYAKQKFLPREAKLRANGLLDMLYTPDDLADELGIRQRDVYRKLLPAGLPHSKDKSEHIWIHGLEAMRWIHDLYRGKHFQLGDNEAFCLKCNKVVPLVNPKKWKSGKMTLLKASCPDCGRTVNRGVKGR